MNYKDITKFTQSGQYQIDVFFDSFVKEINHYINDYGLILCPDFQRGHVWTEQQQVKFIEYVLAGGNSGKNYLFK